MAIPGVIRLKLRSFDHRVLDASASKILSLIKRSGGKVKGPFPLPTMIEKFTVNRSPHVDKKSREQFEIRTHKRIMYIDSYSVNLLKDFGLPADVDIEVDVIEKREAV